MIEREVGGVRFHVSTRCKSLKAAMKQLERFEANPRAYRPEGDESEVEAPLILTMELVHEFVDWQVREKSNTRKHAKEMANRLADWMDDLGLLDLRKVTMRDHIAPALSRRPVNRKHRIIALKSFYSWLRTTKHVLTSAEDPSLDLRVPQAVPEKQKRRKAVDRERVQRALRHLSGAHRDCLVLLTASGMHTTELERFIRDPESALVDQPPGSGTLAVLVVRHKSGEPYRVPLRTEEHLAAARRLKSKGEMPRRLNLALRNACRAAGVEPFTAGVMRHSVATWAVEMGADPNVVSQFLNHKDPRTTKRFYTDVAAPSVSIPTVELTLIDGGKKDAG